MNFLCQGFPKLSSDGHTGRQTSYACPLPATGQDDSHTIRSAIPENPMLHANLMALSSTEPELWATEVYMAGIGILNVFRSCDLDLDPMTFVYELHPYSLEIHRTCKYERRTSRLSKLSSVLRRDRQVGHFQSRDKDGGHINGSAIPENSMLYTNQMALSFLKRMVEIYISLFNGSIEKNRTFRPLLLLCPSPWPDDLHIRTWLVVPGGTPDVRIWTSYVRAFATHTSVARQQITATGRNQDGDTKSRPKVVKMRSRERQMSVAQQRRTNRVEIRHKVDESWPQRSSNKLTCDGGRQTPSRTSLRQPRTAKTREVRIYTGIAFPVSGGAG